MATSSPASLFSRLDLPALGLPAITTFSPSRSSAPWRAAAVIESKAAKTAARRSRSASPPREIDFFVGKIDGRFDEHAQIRDLRLQLGDARREFALHGTHRGARRGRGAGIDQIGNGFGLRNIDLAVQEGALAELAGPRHAAAEFEQRAAAPGP